MFLFSMLIKPSLEKTQSVQSRNRQATLFLGNLKSEVAELAKSIKMFGKLKGLETKSMKEYRKLKKLCNDQSLKKNIDELKKLEKKRSEILEKRKNQLIEKMEVLEKMKSRMSRNKRNVARKLFPESTQHSHSDGDRSGTQASEISNSGTSENSSIFGNNIFALD